MVMTIEVHEYTKNHRIVYIKMSELYDMWLYIYCSL